MAKLIVPPVRHPVFEAYIELPAKDGRAPVRLPLIFRDTTRAWAEYFNGVSRGLQPFVGSLSLIALAPLIPAADRVPYFTGPNTAALAVFTAYARTLVAAADAAAARDVLGATLGIWPVTVGGTGLATVAQGDLLYGSALNTLLQLAKDANATRYLSNTGAGNNPAWAQIDLTNGVVNRLPFANLAQGAALSVLGVTGNATADLASIVAATDNQVLRRSGTAVAFGAVNLASSDAVTGTLPAGNLPAASETASGIVELATNAEAVTGTDAVRAIVPSSLTARLAAPGSIGGTTPAAGAFTTLSATGTITPSQTNGIVGTTTNNNANAGSVGELVESSVTSQTVTTAAGNLTSISLTAGDWDVAMAITSDNTGSAVAMIGGISQTSATFAGTAGKDFVYQSAVVAVGFISLAIPRVRISLAATTTIYLVAVTFTANITTNVDGYISARRER